MRLHFQSMTEITLLPAIFWEVIIRFGHGKMPISRTAYGANCQLIESVEVLPLWRLLV